MKLRISARAARATTIAVVAVAGVAGVTTYAVAQARDTAQKPTVTCHATQPVYTDNDYKLVGSWQVTLQPGQEVFLPDSDVATCLPNGTLDVEQP